MGGGRIIIPSMRYSTRPTPEKIEKEGEQVGQGPLYRVIVHNDDVTPMDFVIHILIAIFFVPEPNASHIMYTAHLNGQADVQTLPKPEAQKRIGKAHFAARLSGYPLKFTMEPA